jgi:hypothetical protein
MQSCTNCNANFSHKSVTYSLISEISHATRYISLLSPRSERKCHTARARNTSASVHRPVRAVCTRPNKQPPQLTSYRMAICSSHSAVKNTIICDVTPCSPVDARRRVARLFLAGCFVCLFFDPKDRGNMFLRNVGDVLPD